MKIEKAIITYGKNEGKTLVLENGEYDLRVDYPNGLISCLYDDGIRVDYPMANMYSFTTTPRKSVSEMVEC